MANLTAAKRYKMQQRNPEMINTYPVKSGTQIYYGALVCIDSVAVAAGVAGRLTNWNASSGALQFMGIAIPRGTRDNIDNVTGNAGGSIVCEVYEGGATLEDVAVTGVVDERNVGDSVYASDNQTFTLTATSNVGAVGRVVRYKSGTTCDIQLFSAQEYRALESLGKV